MKYSLILLAFIVAIPDISAQDSLINYKRSSLWTFMVSNSEQEQGATIQEAFTTYPIPDKFNDHNGDLRLVSEMNPTTSFIAHMYNPTMYSEEKVGKMSNKEKEKYETAMGFSQFLKDSSVAKAMVAKWFNRSETGGFNMNLIAERGSYNASEIDIKIARESERGMALVQDAGEELIQNTFVVVNDFKYTNKEEVAKKASGLLSGFSSIASLAGAGDVSLVADVANVGVGVMGKGYVIKTDAYLFKLVWNEEVANIFYSEYWTDNENLDPEKVAKFDTSDLFKLEYIGVETAWADLQSTAFTKKTDEELITIATKKAADAVIAKLQRSYEVFRTKTPLMTGDPIAAKIGLKEGLEKGDKYEVLEQIINDEGKTEYKRVGVIKVDKENIWDNRYLAEEENPSEVKYTTFKGSKNKYYSGMLIRQIN